MLAVINVIWNSVPAFVEVSESLQSLVEFLLLLLMCEVRGPRALVSGVHPQVLSESTVSHIFRRINQVIILAIDLLLYLVMIKLTCDGKSNRLRLEAQLVVIRGLFGQDLIIRGKLI